LYSALREHTANALALSQSLNHVAVCDDPSEYYVELHVAGHRIFHLITWKRLVCNYAS